MKDINIDNKFPIYSTNEVIIERRRQENLKEIGKFYKNLPQLTKEDYMLIKQEFENGNKKIVELLMEKSLYHIVDVVAKLYAKYDLESIMPMEDGLSFAIYNFQNSLNNFTDLPSSYSGYVSNVINYFVFRYFLSEKTRQSTQEKQCVQIESFADMKYLIDGKFYEDDNKVFNRKEFAEQFFQICDNLTPKEKKVLFLRLGLETGITHTNQEVADLLGITKSNAHDTYVRALRAMRQRKEFKVLLDYKDQDMSF